MVARVHEGAVQEMKTMDEMAEDEASWPLLRDLLRSGQVPDDRVAELVIEYPAFADWYVDGFNLLTPEQIELSPADSLRLAEALANPPEPTPALRKAAEARRKLFGDKP
jgi:hypothetical protein